MLRLLIVSISIVLLSLTAAQSQTRTTPIGVGDTAPDFTLEDHVGSKVTLGELRRRSHVVLVFYRGYW